MPGPRRSFPDPSALEAEAYPDLDRLRAERDDLSALRAEDPRRRTQVEAPYRRRRAEAAR